MNIVQSFIVKNTFLIFTLLLLFACSNKSTKNTSVQAATKGIIDGKLVISPIRPVQSSGKPQTVKKEWYKGKVILFYSEDEKVIVAKAPVDDQGNFKISLAPGIYMAKLNAKGIQAAYNLSKKVIVKPGQTERIKMNFDTGIR